MRDREKTTLEVTVEELDLESEGQPRVVSNENQSTGFGIVVADLSRELAQRLRAPSDLVGAVIMELEPRGAAARAGMQQGDIVIEVNRVAVSGVSDAVEQLQLVESGETAFFLIWRGGSEIFIQATKE